MKALEPYFSMVSPQDDISNVEPPVTNSVKMVPYVYASFYTPFTFSIHASVANLVSIRARAALQTIALALKQAFGVNMHVTVPRTVSLLSTSGVSN